MSIAAMTYVWEHSQHKGNELILLLAVADYANEHGLAWPGIDTLARRIRANRSTAQRCLKRVVGTGEIRVRQSAGPKGCNMYQIVMVASLPLFAEQHMDEVGGGKWGGGNLPPVANLTKGGGIAVPPEPSRTTIKPNVGQSPTAQCSEAYRHGIKARYQADYPHSAKLNGIMAQLVKELGADPALAVVKAYLASNDKWYLTKRHALEYLKRDAAQIWIQLQERSGGAAKPPATATTFLSYEGAKPESRLNDYPVDEPERIARRVLADYGKRIPGWGGKHIIVQIGARRATFSVAELGR